MAELRMHANRNLRPRQLSSGETRGLPNYYAFTHDSRPSWWSDELSREYGVVIGVYENMPSSATDALIIREYDLIVLNDERTSFRYADVRDFDQLVKEPISPEITAHLNNGSIIRIPIAPKDGSIFDFLRFLMAAVHDARSSH